LRKEIAILQINSDLFQQIHIILVFYSYPISFATTMKSFEKEIWQILHTISKNHNYKNMKTSVGVDVEIEVDVEVVIEKMEAIDSYISLP